MFVEVFLRAAHRDHGCPSPGGHRRHGRADAATVGIGNHDDATVESEVLLHSLLFLRRTPLGSQKLHFVRTTYVVLLVEEYYSEAWTGLSRKTLAYRRLLSGLGQLDNVQPKQARPFRREGPRRD